MTKENFKNKYKVGNEDKKEKLELEVEVIEKEEAKKIYKRHLACQKEMFLLNLDVLTQIITAMYENGRVSEYTELNARIKSFESAYTNSSIKALNDIWGVEILTGTESERDEIVEELKKYYKQTKLKYVNKENGYKAINFAGYFNKKTMEDLEIPEEIQDYCPQIEVQGKTIEVSLEASKEDSKSSHSGYKKVNKEEKTKQYLQGEIKKEDLPKMYKWNVGDENVKLLSTEETIRKQYPFLPKKRKTRYTFIKTGKVSKNIEENEIE